MKNVSLHYVVFNLAKAWDGISDEKIQKYCKRLQPNAVNSEDEIANDNLISNTDFKKVFAQLPKSKDIVNLLQYDQKGSYTSNSG